MSSRLRGLPVLLALSILLPFGMSAASNADPTAALTRIIGKPSQPTAFRIWTRPDRPRSAEARFLEYDAMSGLAHFERPDGRKASSPLRKLCAADQRFIAASLGEKPLQYVGSAISPPSLVPTLGPVIRLVPSSTDGKTVSQRPVSLPTALPWKLVSAQGKFPATSIARFVDLRTTKQQAPEPLPAPDAQEPSTQTNSDPWGRRVALYGCRSTWHLIDDIGTGTYQRQGRWWLTALRALDSPPIQPGCWYYRDDPKHNDSRRFWIFCLHKSCCGHVCGHSCGGHCHHHCHHHHCHYDIAIWRFKNGRFELYDYAHKVRMLNPIYDLP